MELQVSWLRFVGSVLETPPPRTAEASCWEAEVQMNHVTTVEVLVLLHSSGLPVPGFSQRSQRPESGLQKRESADPDGTQNCGDGGDGGDAALTPPPPPPHTHTHVSVFPWSDCQTGSGSNPLVVLFI